MPKLAPFFISLLLFALNGLIAQTINNGSFEYWEIQDVTTTGLLTKENPKGWTSRNHVETNPLAVFCYKSTDSYNGVRAAVLQNYLQSNGLSLSSYLSLGAFDETAPQKRGVAFNARPYAMHFAYKYFTTDVNPNGFYSAKATIELSKWDEATGKRVVIGRGEKLISNKVSFYEKAEVVIQYASTQEPDSMQIIFTTPNNPDDDVRLTIDQVYLQMDVHTTGSDDRLFPDEVSIFANPVKDELTFFNPLDFDDASILVYNSVGQLLLEKQIAGTGGKINCQNLSAGMYFYQIRRSDELVKAGKLLKKDF